MGITQILSGLISICSFYRSDGNKCEVFLFDMIRNSEKLLPPNQIIWIIWAVFLASSLMLHAVIVVINRVPIPGPSLAQSDVFQQMMWVLGALEAIAVMFLRSFIARKSTGAISATLFPLFIIGLALSESIVILGFILGFQGSLDAMLPLGMVGMALIISFCPGILFKK